MGTDQRRRDLARIHIACKELGLDDATYRAMLWFVAKVDSAARLDAQGRAKVLDHLRRCGWRPRPKRRREGAAYPGRPRNMDNEDRGPLLRKIEALLSDQHLPWAYADGIARKMFQVDKVQWCKPDQLHKVVAALSYRARRKGRVYEKKGGVR